MKLTTINTKKPLDFRFIFVYSEGDFAGSGAGGTAASNWQLAKAADGETQNGLQPYGLGALVQFPECRGPANTETKSLVLPAAWG